MSTRIKPWMAGGSIAVYIGESIFKIVAINASNTGSSWGGGSTGYQSFGHSNQKSDEFAGIFDTKIAQIGSVIANK